MSISPVATLAQLPMWLLPVLAFVVPLAAAPMLADKFELAKATALKFSFVLVLLAVAARSTVDVGVFRTAPGMAALLYLGASALATIASFAPRTALFGSFDENKGLLTTALMVGCFFLASVWVRTESAFARLVQALVLAATTISVYAIAQQVRIDPIAWSIFLIDGRVVTATLGYPNSVGEFLVMSIPLTAWLAARSRGLQRDLPLWSLLLQLVALWLIQTRTAWVTLFAEAVIAVPIIFCMRRSVPRELATLVATTPLIASLIAAGMLLFVPAPRWPSDNPLLNRITEYRGSPLETRQELWKAAVRLVADRPLLGWGPDTFRLAYPSRRSVELDTLTNQVGRDDNAHNLLLQTSVSSGLSGLLTYVAVQIAVGLLLVRTMFGHDTPGVSGLRWAACALLLALISYQILFLFGRNRITTDWMSWLLGGSAVGLLLARPNMGWRLALAHRVGAVLLAFALVVDGALGLLADASFEAGLQASIEASNQALGPLRQAALVRPFEPAYHEGLAIQLLETARQTGDQALLADAVASFSTASALYSHRDAYAIMRLARAQVEADLAAGRASDTPLEHVRLALTLDPQNPLLFLLAADLAGRMDKPALAGEFLDAGRSRVRSEDARVLLDEVSARLGV
jgi:O-antigen ligase